MTVNKGQVKVLIMTVNKGQAKTEPNKPKQTGTHIPFRWEMEAEEQSGVSSPLSLKPFGLKQQGGRR